MDRFLFHRRLSEGLYYNYMYFYYIHSDDPIDNDAIIVDARRRTSEFFNSDNVVIVETGVANGRDYVFTKRVER